MQTTLSCVETRIRQTPAITGLSAVGNNGNNDLMQDLMYNYFPMDMSSVKRFAVARNMTCEHLRQFARTLGLSVKCSSRRGLIPGFPRGTCDRIIFGIKKPAMDILTAQHVVVKTCLFKFGVSVKTGLFNASE